MILKPDLLFTEQPARRGFLRSLIAAPAAALATHRLILPSEAHAAPADAEARLQRHLAGAEEAMRELFPYSRIRRWGTALEDRAAVAERLRAGDGGAIAIFGVDARTS